MVRCEIHGCINVINLINVIYNNRLNEYVRDKMQERVHLTTDRPHPGLEISSPASSERPLEYLLNEPKNDQEWQLLHHMVYLKHEHPKQTNKQQIEMKGKESVRKAIR
jgi:hypothetical protein